MRRWPTTILTLVLLSVIFVPAAGATSHPVGAITVTVTEDGTGTPISNMLFSLERVDGAFWSATTTETSPGVFALTDLETGDYYLRSIQIDNTHVAEWYNDVPSWDKPSAAIITVTDAGNVPLSVSLEPAGALFGKTENENTMAVIPGEIVTGYDSAGNELGSTTADGGGAWMLEGLPAGDVFLGFWHPTGAYKGEFWEDATSLADATPVTVEAGNELYVGTVKLELVSSISGTVTEAGTGLPAVDVSAIIYDETGTWLGSGMTNGFGQYTVFDLPPGNVKVQFLDGAIEYFETEWYDDQPDLASATVVSLPGGVNTPNIDAVLSASPGNYTLMTISGTPRVGEVLTANTGMWSGTLPISYSYQWLRCTFADPDCLEIGGATVLTYTAVAADVGFRLVLEVTATNVVATTIALSGATGVILDVAGTPFADTAASVHASAIETIRTAGITRGCNPPANTEFCPDGNVTRGQMAAFLNRLMGFPAPDRDYFTDDDGSIFEADINRLATAGVTSGCNPPTNDNFCPDDNVTRAQMAAFLSRTLSLPSAGSDYFTDDAASIFENDINRLAAAGITTGCNPPTNDNYCPDDLVTRAQMATFLTRALAYLSSS
ncbi:MAG: hypothetical protein GXP36_04415 [Actinobacteria bacterium]|nr:hypothetical protein [Actinomycetota bacterium]